MDDITWIASSKEELKHILSETDSYYTFMNIKVNKQKSILMTNNTSHITNNHTTLKFGSEHITLPNTSKDQSIRFLDVWFSLQGSQDFNVHKAYQITSSTSQKLSFKRLTGNHIKYITNQIVIPQLDFLLQCTVLTKHDYTKVIAPLYQTFKHKSYLNSTTSNNVIHSQFLYELINFECHHITNMILSLHK